jgi:hypothetical protein
VVRAPDCQFKRRISPGFQSQHPPAQRNLRGGRRCSVEEKLHKNQAELAIDTEKSVLAMPPALPQLARDQRFNDDINIMVSVTYFSPCMQYTKAA